MGTHEARQLRLKLGTVAGLTLPDDQDAEAECLELRAPLSVAVDVPPKLRPLVGRVPFWLAGQPCWCQKHPCTEIAIRRLLIAMSGLPGRLWTFARNH